MPEVHDRQAGGSNQSPGQSHGPDNGPETQASGSQAHQRTPEETESIRKYWDQKIAQTTDPDERQTLIALREIGVPPVGGGAEVIDPTDYPDPALAPLVEGLNNELRGRIDRGEPPILDLDYLSRQLERLERLIDEGRITDLGQATRLQQTLNSWRRESIEVARGAARGERFGFLLQPADIEVLRENPTEWLDNQFDTLYKIAAEGQELNSPIVSNIQQVVSEAIRWLQYNKPPEDLERFQTLFTIRFNLLSMRTTIGYRGVENIQGAAMRLGLHGLMYGISMEEGKVGSMFNRLHELLEDERLKNPEHHAKPEVVSKLQDHVIAEQLDLAEKGIGQFGNLQENREQVTRDIVRAVRLAYDVFVSSQRQAVIVARGRRLSSEEAYFSDPASGPLNVYNLEDLLIKKFNIYNAHDQEFVRRIKIDMAETSVGDIKRNIEGIRKKAKEEQRALTAEEQSKIESLAEEVHKRENLTELEKEDLGTRLFRDLFAVPDFFSSGWRIKGVLDSIDERFIARFGETEGRERARDFALFMRLKAPETRKGTEEGEGDESREQVWGRIAEIRPEEVVRLYRERDEGNPRLAALFNNDIFIRNNVNSYADFKDEFGPILRLLRENGYRELRQLRIADGGFTPEEAEQIRQYFGEDKAGDLREMFNLMTDFSQESIENLMKDNKFEDIYTRTLLIDDALLDRLEDPTGGLTPLSKRYAADQGGDALARNWTDTANAIQAGQNLIKFIKSENTEDRIKAAEDFGEFTSQYNGQEARAKCIRYTIGTFLSLSKSDFIWDSLGVGKLPFRKAMSEIEKIYGPQAQPMSRDQLRVQLDKIHLVLVGELKKNFSSMAPEKQEEELERVETLYRNLEKVLEVTAKDMVKRRAFSFLIFLILAAILETYKVGEGTVKAR